MTTDPLKNLSNMVDGIQINKDIRKLTISQLAKRI